MAGLRMKPPITDIRNHFDTLGRRVFKRSDIQEILSENREYWRLGNSVTTQKFINYLLESSELKLKKFECPNSNILRYAWGEVSTYEVIASLKPDSYFTHYTAMSFHDLTEQIPNKIYLNFEQERKNFGDGELEQSRIDAAFKRPVRVSKTIVKHDSQIICILNGMFTDRIGVTDFEDTKGAHIPITNIERTLIDIAVRPVYSGGVFEVQKAYKLAEGRFSVNRLSSMLKKIGYIYPYHQVICFYLDNAGGYKDSAINLLRKFDIKFDFYLTHDMKNTAYSKKWRLHYPKGL